MHINDEGTEIHRDVIRGVIGESYTTKKYNNYYYNFDRIEGDAEGTFTTEPITVTYHYQYNQPNGIVFLDYKTTEGHSLYFRDAPASISGPRNSSYTIEPFNSNREYIFDVAATTDALTGTYRINPHTITLVYRRRPNASINVKHYTEDNRLISTNTIHGRVGLPYNIPTYMGEQYEFIRNEGQLTGKFLENEEPTISLYYRERPIAGEITVNHIDDITKQTIKTTNLQGYVDLPYSSDYLKPLSNYDFIRAEGAPQEGIFTTEEQTITFFYRRQTSSIQVRHHNIPRKYTIKTEYINGKDGEVYSIDTYVNDERIIDRIVGGELSGHIPYGETTIDIYYIDNPNRVTATIRYANQMTVELADPTYITGNIGEKYIPAIPQTFHEDYVYAEAVGLEPDGSFTFSPEMDTIWLYYNLKGKITIRHIYRNRPELNREIVIDGLEDDPYTSEEILHEGVVLTEIQGEPQGYLPIASDNATITYYYD